ncbi:MAG: CBS domain-containing protein [Actinomycetes bacterium]
MAEPLLRVSDAMSSPIVILRSYDSVWHAVDRFIATGLRHLVVLDGDDGLVGVLEDRHVLADWPLDVVRLQRHTVGELLRAGSATPVDCPRLHRGVHLRDAGLLMIERGLDALPVVDESGQVVGILTRSDLLRSLVLTAPDNSHDEQTPAPLSG